ncbi:FAD-dependent oxidoreductase [Nocardia arthritidis]|uniref:FAD-dependent oxidoreductase n=1 Tax=Nocardia arthritidis TaxID=228602 RepID=A0A6G9YKI9_9NOCA|nr:FAD-dependent oxidoreductase [Nocardia arthritidis]QIS13453.1 FAD-dependent oxidoreductase [Nocardia arthritidis]
MERTTCLIAGGGPAGIVLGLLLARGGVDVTVLEKHKDFLRDFRGDTVHPTTLDLLDELGLGAEFAKLPQRRVETILLPVNGALGTAFELRNLPGKHKYIAMVPQWDLLDLLARNAEQEPSFHLRMNTEATDLIRDDGRVVGIAYRTSSGETGEIRADLTVACDGRGSVLRAAAGLPSVTWTTPMDVWWFRLPRTEIDPAGAVPFATGDRAGVMLDRGDYWQVALLIAKGTDAAARRNPVGDIVRGIARVAPWLGDRVDALSGWDEVKLLDVKLDRLRRWYTDGLLCLGDAAHAMSPVGGVGINLAVQDAVAAARILAGPLRSGSVRTEDLARVQRRRMYPTVATQAMQRLLHDRVIEPALYGRINLTGRTTLPPAIAVLRRIPVLRTAPPFVVARGFLPEHAPEFARRTA